MEPGLFRAWECPARITVTSPGNGGVQRPAIIAWLRFWIYNDTGARNYFHGNDCVMCKAPWENPQRKLWQE